MRTLAALLGILFVVPSWAAGGSSDPIDLGRPGVLERLREDRPAQYLAVTQILRVAEKTPCKEGELETLKVQYDVRDWKCSFLVLTSYPAKRHLSFALEGTRYVATVTLKDVDGKIRPAVDEK
ncbi:MAG: hypothetical protein ACM3X5_05440 [Bacillota bacterium]